MYFNGDTSNSSIVLYYFVYNKNELRNIYYLLDKNITIVLHIYSTNFKLSWILNIKTRKVLLKGRT
jgi:hypothetical protein